MLLEKKKDVEERLLEIGGSGTSLLTTMSHGKGGNCNWATANKGRKTEGAVLSDCA